MRIVESNGEYAVARGRWIFTQFLDLYYPGHWWIPDGTNYKYCWGSMRQVEEALQIASPRKYKTFKEL